MRLIRITLATGAASMLTIFAVLGMVHLVEIVALRVGTVPIAVSRGSLDFGRVPLNSSAIQTLVVRNDGGGAVRARFVLEGTTYSVEPSELVLQPGIEQSIAVQTRPEEPGWAYDVLRIEIGGRGAVAVAIPLATEAGPEGEAADPNWELNRV